MRRWLVVAGLGALCLVVIVALWRPRAVTPPPRPRPTPTAPGQPLPALTVEGVEGLAFQQEGRKVWELFADRITLDKSQTQAVAHTIRKAIYYAPDGRPVFWLSADTLRYDATQGLVTVEGAIRVHARLPRGRQLVAVAERAVWRERERWLEAVGVKGQVDETQFLVAQVRYAPERGVLVGAGGVVVVRPDLQLTCPAVRANLPRRYILAEPPVQVALFGGLEPLVFRPVAQQPPAKKEERKRSRILLRTDKPVVLKGDELVAHEVVITEEGEDYTVTAPRAVYNRATEQVQVEGGIRFEDPETVATAPRAQIDARKRVAVFFGPVEVVVKPRKEAAPKAQDQPPSAQNAPSASAPPEKQGAPSEGQGKQRERFREQVRRRGGRLVCERAEYYYRERRVVATGNVQFEQPGRYKGRADRLIYLTRDELLTLEGNIVVDELTKGHRFQCPRAVINLQSDEAHFDPPVRVEFIVTEEEEAPEKPAEKGKPAPAPPKEKGQ